MKLLRHTNDLLHTYNNIEFFDKMRVEFVCQRCGDIVNIEDESEIPNICKECEKEMKKDE